MNLQRVIALLLFGLIVAAPGYAAAPTGKIPGQSIQRHNGTWLGIQLGAGNFRVTFYARDKTAMPADASSVVLSWAAPKTGTYAPPPVSTQLFPLPDISSVFTNSYYVALSRPINLRITLTVPSPDPSSIGSSTEVYTVRFPPTG